MLWLNHPKRDQPAAMLIQRERLSGHASNSRTGSALPIPAPLQLSIRYALPEYVSFMWQHAGFLIRRRRIGTMATYWMLSRSTLMAALHFVAQGRARRTYEFTIDQHGVVRTSGTGVTLVPWAEVRAIRRYSCGYMMVLARGTLPIPYRCLGQDGLVSMDGFSARVRAAALSD